MHKLASAVLFGCTLSSAGIAPAQTVPPAPSHVGRHASTPEDIRAIEKVVADFQAALIAKDVKLLSSLMLHTNILFASPADDAFIEKMRDTTDVHFDGVAAAGYVGFANYIKREPLRTALGFIGITDIEFVQAEGVAMGEEAVASAIAKGRASIEALAA